MRIALFSETYLPSINGVVTHVKTLKEGLEAMGHQVLVVTADCKVRRHHVSDDGVLHCPAFKSTRFYGYSIAKPVSRTRYKLVKEFNPDIIHIHDEYGISLSGITIAKLLKKPLVYTLHTMYDQYLYYISPKLLMPFTQKLVHTYNKFIADKASAITGPSAKCGAYLSEIGIKSPVTVIPNAVELDMFEKTNANPDIVSQIKEQFNIGDKTVFCFVGRLGKEKSVDVLFNYLAEEITIKDNIIMMIVGDGPVADDLKKQADKLGISEFVRFTGSIPHDKLNTYYYCC
ncbi:MAG: glycosyltransferase, partial [Oscillospiraceae bacterium]